jgi:hypothetical protein
MPSVSFSGGCVAAFAGEPQAGVPGGGGSAGVVGGAALDAGTLGGAALAGVALDGAELGELEEAGGGAALDEPYGRPSGASGARISTFPFPLGASDALDGLEPAGGLEEESPLAVCAFAASGETSTNPASAREATPLRRFTHRR